MLPDRWVDKEDVEWNAMEYFSPAMKDDVFFCYSVDVTELYPAKESQKKKEK